MILDPTRRGVLRVAAVTSLVAAQSFFTRTEVMADSGPVAPRLELLAAGDVDLHAQSQQVTIPQVLGARIVVGSEDILSGSRLRFSGPMDAYDVSRFAVLGSTATGVVSDLPAKASGKNGDVVVTVSEVLASGGEYTVVVGTAVGERYPHTVPGRLRSGTALLESTTGVVLASTPLTGKATTAVEDPWAVALAYTPDTTGEPASPTGWVTVHSVGPRSVPKGGEILVLLDRSEGRPGLALGRAGASRPDTSRSSDAALTRHSGGSATYKIRIDDAIPAGKSIVIPLNAPDGGAPIRAIEYRAATREGSQRITGAESIEVLLPVSG
jgi:hypothetical protein